MGTSASFSFKLTYKTQTVSVDEITSFADLQTLVNINFTSRLHLGIHQVRFLYKPLNFEICTDRDLVTVKSASETAGLNECVITLERIKPQTTKGSFALLEEKSLYPIVKLKSGIGIFACGLIDRSMNKVVLPSKAVHSLSDLNKHYIAFSRSRISLQTSSCSLIESHNVIVVPIDPDLIPYDVPFIEKVASSFKKSTMCTAVQADSQHFLNLEIVSVTETNFVVQGEPMMLGATLYDLDWHLLGIAVDSSTALRIDVLRGIM